MSILALLGRLRWLYIPLSFTHSRRLKQINSVCKGWSGRVHWRTFRNILKSHPHIRSICILGVYMGRDIAYLSSALKDDGRDFQITGVDLFADVPGEDWPEDKRDLSWQDAGFGTPPSLEKARSNLKKLGNDKHVTLLQSRADQFLSASQSNYDLIYIDVAHDYQTTKDILPIARAKLNPGGVLAGDDYSNLGSWGVARAVKEECPNHAVHYGWIWVDPPRC